MNTVSRLPTAADIDEEAAVWVWRLDGGEASAEQRREFEEWLRRDARHQKAFDELGGVWDALDGLADAKRDEKIALFTRAPAEVAEPPRATVSSGGHRAARWSIAAMLLLSVCIGIFVWLQRGSEALTLATAVGQQRTATLADGSTVYLNTNTILETRFTAGERNIHLVKGEALFDVAHDRERPFLVRAGNTLVRAVGTEFNVRTREAGGVEVVVAEGRVEVESGSGDASPRALRTRRALNAGQRWEATEATSVASLDGAEVARALAWRDGAIIFDGEPLSEAIAELNRYTDRRLIVADPLVRDLMVGGRFKTGDVEGFLVALRQALPVTIRHASDGVIYIESQRRQPSP